MRVMTRRIAGLEPGEWDGAASRLVTELFDELAPDWHTRTSPQGTQVVGDSIERGLLPMLSEPQLCLEVGSGIGTYSGLLAAAVGTVVSVELSWEMISRAGSGSHRVLADGARLPMSDDSADAMVLINAFLFPDEVDRVLREHGVVLWVNSSGAHTPIHLTTDEVAGALPFPVSGVEGRAGAGTWCALRRAVA